MGLALSSDIILDVMRNADPARSRSTAERLTPTGAASAGNDFLKVLKAAGPGAAGTRSGDLIESVLAAASPESFSAATSRLASLEAEPSQRMTTADTASSPVGTAFERMVLRNLYESMMPGADSGSYGEGPAAGIWRSMAADQLASVHAEAGGIGIASMISGPDQNAGLRQNNQWPYFSLDQIGGFVG